VSTTPEPFPHRPWWHRLLAWLVIAPVAFVAVALAVAVGNTITDRWPWVGWAMLPVFVGWIAWDIKQTRSRR
jgi:hypothetical protein